MLLLLLLGLVAAGLSLVSAAAKLLLVRVTEEACEYDGLVLDVVLDEVGYGCMAEKDEESTEEEAVQDLVAEDFGLADSDCSGGISAVELRAYAKEYLDWGESLDEEMFDAEFREADSDGDGQISLDEFDEHQRGDRFEQDEVGPEAFDVQHRGDRFEPDEVDPDAFAGGLVG